MVFLKKKAPLHSHIGQILVSGYKTKTMNVSTLPNFTKGKRLLFVKEQKANDEISLMTLPNTFHSISCLSLVEMIQAYDYRTPMPDAIIVNLNSVTLNKISPIIKGLKNHEFLKEVPVIGLKQEYSKNQKRKLLQLGFSDCFGGPIDWRRIEKRVIFLDKFKDKLTETNGVELMDEPYKMPIGKRIFDLTVAISALLILSPLFLIVGLLIKLSSKGDIFYYSKRVGTGYQIFDFIKFRSMKEGADRQLMNLADINSYGANNAKETKQKDCTFYKIKDDPRVTFIGKIIRKTSIDELPQLINVVRGEMSIVGNRPLPVYEAEKLTCDDWAKRFMAPAGLTGLWQVDKRGKDNLPAEERIKLDMNYADNYSFLLDFKILLMTLPAMVQRD